MILFMTNGDAEIYSVVLTLQIDRLEKRRERVQDHLEKAEFKSRKQRLTEKER